MTILRYFDKMYTINFYMLVYFIRMVLNKLKNSYNSYLSYVIVNNNETINSTLNAIYTYSYRYIPRKAAFYEPLQQIPKIPRNATSCSNRGPYPKHLPLQLYFKLEFVTASANYLSSSVQNLQLYLQKKFYFVWNEFRSRYVKHRLRDGTC